MESMSERENPIDPEAPLFAGTGANIPIAWVDCGPAERHDAVNCPSCQRGEMCLDNIELIRAKMIASGIRPPTIGVWRPRAPLGKRRPWWLAFLCRMARRFGRDW